MFASLSDVGVALKLAGADRDALLAAPGAGPLRYEPDQPPSKSYVIVPEAMLSDLESLTAWIVTSVGGVAPKSGQNRRRPARKP